MPDPIDGSRSLRTSYEEENSSDAPREASSTRHPGTSALDVDWDSDGGMSSKDVASRMGDAPSSSLAPTQQQLAAARTAKSDRPIESDPLGNALIGAVAGGSGAALAKLAGTSTASLAIAAGCDKAALSLVKSTAKTVALQALKSAVSGPPVAGNSERGVVPLAAAPFVPSMPEAARGGTSSPRATSDQRGEASRSFAAPWVPSPLLPIRG